MRIDGSRAEILADKDDNDFLILFNSGLETTTFILAAAPGKKKWFRAIDTGYSSPKDILPAGKEEALATAAKYRVKSRSMVILISKD